jgi:Secreted Novel AID/APOBEC-like Deaminase 4/Domain of unknown function (DUF4157)
MEYQTKNASLALHHHSDNTPFFNRVHSSIGTAVIQKMESPFFAPNPPNPFFKKSEHTIGTPSIQAKTESHQPSPHSACVKTENKTGMTDGLKNNVEALSGMDMSDVRVQYASAKPAELGALAYAQGNDIHVASGQEQHLAHEAWHVVQQKQRRVQPTLQMKGSLNINDDIGLENEADVMGNKIMQTNTLSPSNLNAANPSSAHTPIQRVIDFSKTAKTVPAKDIKELIEFFVSKYGESNRAFITTKTNEINDAKANWSLYDVYRFFNDAQLPVFTEVAFGQHSSKPTLPGSHLADRERYAAVNQFGFNTVTTLVGIVGMQKFETRNSTEDKEHAEEVFVNKVEDSKIELNEDTVVTITINNSPCHAKCSSFLAKWVARNKLKAVTIHFANPFGTAEEFSAAIKILQNEGIKVHGFIPLKHIGSDTDDEIEPKYRKRFDKMEGRLRSAKKDKLYESDKESDSEGFDEKLSSKLLEKARAFWDDKIDSIVEETNARFSPQEAFEAIDSEDVVAFLTEKTENPYDLDFIENYEELNTYLLEIENGINEYADSMREQYE